MNEARSSVMRGGVGAFCALMLVGLGCGGGDKHADSPSNCPDGTLLKGSDCVPAGGDHESEGSSAASTSESTGGSKSDDHASSGSSGGGSSSPAASEPSPSGKTPYDRDSVEVELKRASRQVKANCGSATDENGAATGPWGKTTASVTLGRNGHIRDMTVPAPFDGKPDGLCAVNAFKKIQFPPYSSSSDVVIPWDIEFVKPKH
jgi:hypothetical protein